jgi:hypothetical protein
VAAAAVSGQVDAAGAEVEIAEQVDVAGGAGGHGRRHGAF